jgi:glycosyltransferase involved in cell wall biosynthesis
MRIVFVSHNYSPDINRPEDWFERIKIYSGSLSCLSRQHQIIRIERINYTGSCVREGIQYYFTTFHNRKLYFPWRFHRFVASTNPDVVIMSGTHFPMQAIQLRLHLGKRVKIFVQNHAEKPFPGPKKYLQRLADHFIDGYFFASTAMGRSWVSKGNIGSVSKIHEVMEVSSNFYPLERPEAIQETGVRGSHSFLWVGRLDENKNPEMVVRAFSLFAKSTPDASLYMIYQSDELLPAIQHIISEENFPSKTIFLVGKQPHDRLLYWYNSADFIISGSWYEGSGTAVCEAMSCGCIPILTDIFSFRAMTGGHCGILYEPGSENGLLSALESATQLDKAFERKKVLEQFQDALSFEAIARNIQRVLFTESA